MSGQMSPHRYGKENWAYSELKQILSIEFLNLCCQATVDCTTTFSLFYTPTVRSLLKKLSNTPSDLFKFSAVLRDLASVLSCRTHHRGWEERICQRWTLILYEAGEEEGRYLMERKIIQAEVETRKFMAKTPKLKLESVAPSSDKPVVPAVPSISGFFKDRNRPKPIVHCIRHGEAGSGREKDYFIRDPDLTAQGIKDCKAFSQAFDRHDHITHLIVSPLSRTISSAIDMFTPAIAYGIKLTLVPEIQAASSCFSCIGIPRDELMKKYRKWEDSINFDFIGTTWTKKLDGPYSSHYDSVHKRVKEIVQWCRDGKDSDDGKDGRREIVLVTHQSILIHLGHTWEVSSAGWTTWTFDDRGKCYETAESKLRRRAPDTAVLSSTSTNSIRASSYGKPLKPRPRSRILRGPVPSVVKGKMPSDAGGGRNDQVADGTREGISARQYYDVKFYSLEGPRR